MKQESLLKSVVRTVDKLVGSFFLVLLAATATASEDDYSIYIKSGDEIFQYTHSKLIKVEGVKSPKLKYPKNATGDKLDKNLLSSIFASAQKAGCNKIKKATSIRFHPYRDFEHFKSYIEVSFLNNRVSLISPGSRDPGFIAVTDEKQSYVCSSGFEEKIAFLIKNDRLLYTQCDSDICDVVSISLKSKEIEIIATIEGEVVDLDYDYTENQVLILYRQSKGLGIGGKVLAKLGHGREKYRIGLLKVDSCKEKTNEIIVDEVVNPYAWIGKILLEKGHKQ